MKQSLFVFLVFLLISDLCAQLPDYRKRNVRVYLLIGQSNMAGRGKIEKEDTISHPRVWMLTKDYKWVIAREPVHFDKPGIAGVGPALSFGKAMAAKHPDAIIALIPAAVGGTSIDSWREGILDSATKTFPYDNALARVRFAKAYGELSGILWHQGESDCAEGKVELYEDKLRALVNSLRRDVRARKAEIAFGTLGDFLLARNHYAIKVNEAIRRVGKRMRIAGIADAAGLVDRGDKLHFDAKSARELGMRYAQLFR